MLEDHIEAPYSTDLEPALSAGAYVQILPSGEMREVDAVEVIPAVTTQEVTVPANGTINEEEMTQLYAQDGALAQLRLPDPEGGQAIPDGIEITVDNGGEESPRFNLKNSRGRYTADVPSFGVGAPQTELWMWENTDLFFTFENTTGGDITVDLTYTGWVYPTNRTGEAVPDITVLTERFGIRG